MAALVACEALARLLLPPPRYHDAPLELDPELGFRGIPGFRQELADDEGRYELALNRDGVRGRELPAAPAPRPAGEMRVLFVGDSFLVGQAVREEQLVTSRVEAALRARGLDAEAYNLSAIDWGTAQELLALRRSGPALAPDAVVLFLYPANDLINNTRALAQRTTVSAGDPIRPYLEPEHDALRVRYLQPWRAWLRRHSRLFAVLERRVLGTRAVAPIREDYAQRLRQGLAPREDFELFRPHRDAGDPWAAAWSQSFALLRAFRRECEALGARLVVVVVPSAYQVVRNPKALRLDVLSRRARGVGLDELLDWNLPERELARFFAEEGIEALFLLGPLRESAAAGASVFARDEHLTARGHEIAALAVASRLAAASAPAADAAAALGDAPVRVLGPAAEAPALLDFGADRQLARLGDGFIAWTPPREGRGGGWLIHSVALVALPWRDGDLVLRGRVPPQARLPIAGWITVVGGSSFRFRLEAAGPFALRFPVEARERAGWTQSDGYVAVLLAPGETHRVGSVAAGLVVEAVGFEAPASGAAEPDSAARAARSAVKDQSAIATVESCTAKRGRPIASASRSCARLSGVPRKPSAQSTAVQASSAPPSSGRPSRSSGWCCHTSARGSSKSIRS